ncbi:GNAT family N-acetyltransferase [Rhizobium paknamense]|uniref:RimJ/RimL family protein N-acetyltransferase n=1 Tax=Rhizobium paknamense TaxID=1206817 RepID=A0ABU0I915_9HYPH|nr:GNAT family protein [Rhizobium paknamense]MDQ0454103.1 RimJ/RimL family protein N-acetyltransferase [Rhizobium paknamense]
MPAIRMRRASETDIDFMMSAERQPGYAELVGRFTEDEYRAEMAKADSAVMIGEDDGVPVGLVILQNIHHHFRNIYIKRVVVEQAGHGIGTAMMQSVTDWAFTELNAYRLWLSAHAHNLRAQRVYEKVGFRQEGVQCGAYGWPDGRFTDLVQMSLLQPEWQALAATRDLA